MVPTSYNSCLCVILFQQKGLYAISETDSVQSLGALDLGEVMLLCHEATLWRGQCDELKPVNSHLSELGCGPSPSQASI